jgi:serine/threonine-protein kinase RsbW/stage II sporulation protein AB (anti-sigma F factor)
MVDRQSSRGRRQKAGGVLRGLPLLHLKGAIVARERPTASEDQTRVSVRDLPGREQTDALTRAQARALSRCAPLRRPAPPAAVSVHSAHWRAAADPDHVGELRRQVASFASNAGMPGDDLAEVLVAVSEALSNAALHAYRDRDFDGDVRVDAEVVGGELLIRVRDYGGGIAPRADSPGMGLGLSIIARLSKRHSVRRCDGGGTEVGMCFDLVRAGGVAAH